MQHPIAIGHRMSNSLRIIREAIPRRAEPSDIAHSKTVPAGSNAVNLSAPHGVVFEIPCNGVTDAFPAEAATA